MVTTGGLGNMVNYEPNSLGGPTEDKKWAAHGETLNGVVGRYPH